MVMGKSKAYVLVYLRMLLGLFVAGICAGCGDRERVVGELHFELRPLTPQGYEAGGVNYCMTLYQAEDVREYFTRAEVHVELGNALGRETDDIGESLTVDTFGDSPDRFILRAEGKDSDEAEVLARAALTHYEGHLMEAQRRFNEERRLHLEQQIKEQKLKVAAAKAKMDVAYEKLKEAEGESGD